MEKSFKDSKIIVLDLCSDCKLQSKLVMSSKAQSHSGSLLRHFPFSSDVITLYELSIVIKLRETCRMWNLKLGQVSFSSESRNYIEQNITERSYDEQQKLMDTIWNLVDPGSMVDGKLFR